MSDEPDYVMRGGAPPCSDMPDHSAAILVPNKNTWQDAENIDPTHGYISYIWIPNETHSVIIMKAHVWAEKFRAYSRGALGGGASLQTSTNAGAHRHMIFDYVSDTPSAGVRRQFYYKGVLGGNIACDLWSVQPTDAYSFETVPDHAHNVNIPAHTHALDFGIFEEGIAGKKLSAALYDKNGVLLHNYGVIITGEGNIELDISAYFTPLVYGMYELRLTSDYKMRVRIMYYEMCYMYAV